MRSLTVIVISLFLCFSTCVLSYGKIRITRQKVVPAFKKADIEQITIVDALERRKVLAVIAKKHWHSIYANLESYRIPTSTHYECILNRRTIIRLRDGRTCRLSYHAQCGSPEVVVSGLSGSKNGRLDNSTLKKRLISLETSYSKSMNNKKDTQQKSGP